MGCLITKMPCTPKGRELLRWWQEWEGFREVYPDGVRHRDIDWDVLAADCEAMEADYFAYMQDGAA